MASVILAKNNDAYIAAARARMGVNVTGVLTGKGTWIDFLTALGGQEGNGSYSADNGQGYIGIYQFANYEMTYNGQPSSIFYTLGFQNSIGAMLNATTDESYKANPIAQELSALMEFSGLPIIGKSFLSQYDSIYNAVLSTFDLDQLVGKAVTINYTDPNNNNAVALSQTFTVTQAGLSAAAHLIGAGGVASALKAAFGGLVNKVTGNLDFSYDASGNQIPLVASLSETGNYADGNHVAFSTYAKLFQNFDISTLVNAQGDPSNTSFNQLAAQLVRAHKDNIIAYLEKTKKPVSMTKVAAGTDYSSTITSILGGLNLSTDQLGNIKGKVILSAGDYSDSSSAQADLIIGLGTGTQTLRGGSGDDVLVAGKGNDILIGEGGANKYILGGPAGQIVGTETITDATGTGTIWIGSTQLPTNTVTFDSTTTAFDGMSFIWKDSQSGLQYSFKPAPKFAFDNQGTLTISGGNLAGGTIVVDNFELKKALTSTGYLGIHLSPFIGLQPGTDLNGSISALINLKNEVLHGNNGVLTLRGAPGQEYTVNSSNHACMLVDGANLKSFDSNGNATFTIPEGQDYLALTLVDTSNSTSPDSVTLTATTTDGSGATVTSNTLTVTFDDLNHKAGSTTAQGTPDLTVYGGYDPLQKQAELAVGAAIDPTWRIVSSQVAKTTTDSNGNTVVLSYLYTYEQVDKVGNVIADTSKPNPSRAANLSGSSGNDYIKSISDSTWITAPQGGNDTIISADGYTYIFAGSGNNTVTVGNGQYDYIAAGDGNNNITVGTGDYDNISVGNGGNAIQTGNGASDYITAGNGNNVIQAGKGQDAYVKVGDGDNQIYADTQVDLGTALNQAKSTATTGQNGINIVAGNGNNTLVGGGGNDLIETGTGNNVIVCGNGQNIVFSGAPLSQLDQLTDLELGSSPTDTDRFMLSYPTPSLTTPPPNAVDLEDGDLAYDFSITSPEVLVGNRVNQNPEGGAIWAPVGGGDNTIYGGSGNSIYWLSNGNNWLDAGDGNDYILGGTGSNTIYSGNGNDTVIGGDDNAGHGSNDFIVLGSGNDSVTLLNGSNTVIGGSGNDTITANGNGNEYIYGGSGNTVIKGGRGNDTLISGTESGNSTTINGGSGNEYIVGGNGNDVINAGSGNDTIYAGDGNITINLGGGSTGGSGEEAGIGAAGNATVYGGNGSVTINGGAGTAVIYAGDGTALVNAGAGTSTIYGGAGSDTLIGGSGADTLVAGTGTSLLQGGSGTEAMFSTIGNATLIAGSGDDTLYGGAGTDVLKGSSGSTFFLAGTGNETIIGGSGTNTYEFDPGFGSVELQQGRASDTLQFGCGINPSDLTVTGTLDSAGNAALLIDDGNGGEITIDGGLDGAISQFTFLDPVTLTFDQLMAQANAVSTTVAGENGNLLFSADSNDYIVGGSGNDTLYGWSGNDTLVSGSGVSTMIGGAGNDTFIVNNSADVVEATSTGNTIESSVSYSMADNAKGVQNLALTGTGDLVAQGNSLDNVITANDGNDTLIGGTGNSTLIGGAGLDTFTIGFDTGTETVIDSSALGGIVHLGSGLSLSDLMASRQGNDVLFQIEGSKSSMLVKDYYANPQTAWSIQDDAGNTTTAQSVLDATPSTPWAPNLGQLETDFLLQAREQFLQGVAGYTQQPDGTHWTSTSSNVTQPESLLSYWYPITVQHNIYYINGQAAQSYTSQTNWIPFNVNNTITEATVALQQTRTVSDASTINAQPSSYVLPTVSETKWAPVGWWYAYSTSTYQSQTVQIRDGQGNLIGYDQQSITMPTWYSGLGFTGYLNSDGTPYWTVSPASLLDSPGTLRTTGWAPQAVPIYVDHTSTVDSIQQIYVGDGNHTVNGGGQWTAVNGGAGNDVISNAGFVYTGQGNDTVTSGGQVYCGSGNNDVLYAGVAYGGSGNDTISYSGSVYGGSGNALFVHDNTVTAGTGHDTILGAANIQIDPAATGTALIGGAASNNNLGWAAYQVLNAFYRSLGIGNWYAGYINPNGYSTPWGVTFSNAQQATAYFQNWGYTLQQATTYGWCNLSAPLPVVATVPGYWAQPAAYYSTAGVPVINITANDYSVLGPLYTKGYLQPAETVTFGAGVLPTDLNVSWGQTVIAPSGLSTDTPSRYTTLNISWGMNGQNVQVIIPHSDEPVGTGVSEFVFADGTKMSMADMIALAPSAPSFDPQLQLQDFFFQPDMGAQVLPAGVSTIRFAAGIDPNSISVAQDAQGNFVVSYNNGAATLTIPAADAIGNPVVGTFANNTSWQFVNANGGTYTYNIGSGVVYLVNAAGNGTVQFGAGITSGMITLGVGSLMLRVGNNSDMLHIEGFNPSDALNSGEIQTFKFADGSVLSYADLLTRGFDIYGTTGNETLTGTNLDNRIHAGAGNDVLIGSGAHDTLYGGVGNDTLIGGAGQELLIAGSGLTTMIGGTGANTFVVNNVADVVQAQAGAANTIETSVSFAAPANVQELIGTGTADIVLTGSDLANTITANSGNDTLVAGSGVAIMVGGAGNDTFVVNNTADVVQAQAGGINTIETSVSYSAAANVQNLVGTGTADITLTGNSLANTITANTGNDILIAGSGVATMIGGAGNDTFVVNNVNDVVQAQSTGSNANTIDASVSYTASANVQNLLGVGSADIVLTGNDLNNVITANSGNDTLIAGSGVATMVGGTGNDTFVVNNANDVVQAQSTGANVNTVLTSVSYVAPANVQNLTGIGNADITLTGNILAGTITANSGNDTLVAGDGVATLLGGTGNDTFVVNNVADMVQAQSTGANVNTVLTSVSYVAPANVQNLTGIGNADITLTGNNLAGTITANSGNDTVVAGSGVATLVGGTGNDTFVVDNAADVVQAQSTGANVNTVLTSVSYVAPANVQNLSGTGTADITLTGGGQSNTITANSGNDTLIAGAGIATMVGGTGNDTFVVNNTADVVQAQSSAGNINTIETSVSYTASANVEDLIGIGNADITLTGNNLAGTITANSGNDTLVAGSGVATMVGGTGNDTFVVNNVNDMVQAQSTGSNINTVLTSVNYVTPANVQNLTGIGSASITLTGNNLADTITANSGNDTLVAGSGLATLVGGVGNDSFYVNNSADLIRAQLTGSNVNTAYSAVDFSLATNGQNVQNLVGTGTGNITLTGNGLNNVITANSGNDTLVSLSGNDTLISGTGVDTLVGGTGNDTFVVNNSADLIQAQLTGSNVNTALTSVSYDMATNAQNVQVLTGTGSADLVLIGNSLNDVITANGGNDLIKGGSGNCTLVGGAGADVLEAGAGNNMLTDTQGHGILLGGAGNDTLTGGGASSFFAGGKGNDTVAPGALDSVVAFNVGDGNDTVVTAAGGANTLSLGGAINFSNLELSRSGNDLILYVSPGDSVTFHDWYASSANRDFNTLQIMGPQAANVLGGDLTGIANEFNFSQIVSAFDQQTANKPPLSPWHMTAALTQAHLSSNNTAAIGGDLAYYYSSQGSLSGMNLASAQTTLKDPVFGSQAQTLHTLPSLQGAPVTL